MKSKLINLAAVISMAAVLVLLCFAVVKNEQRLDKEQNGLSDESSEQIAADTQGNAVDISQADSLNDSSTDEISLGKGLVVTSIDTYSGAFVEDGSDEDVEDVLMITVRNDGDKVLQYAETQLFYDDVTAEFAFSTLKPGQSVTVLEKNRLPYTEGKAVKSTSLGNVVFFEKELDLCEDKLKVSAMDGAFNVENISGQDLPGNVVIYYKNKQDGVYHGGITYRVMIEGGIENGGIKQSMSGHFTLSGSEVMFVDYVEME